MDSAQMFLQWRNRKNLCRNEIETTLSGVNSTESSKTADDEIYGPVTCGFCFVSQRNVPQCEPEINQKQNYGNGVAKRKFSNGAEQNTSESRRRH